MKAATLFMVAIGLYAGVPGNAQQAAQNQPPPVPPRSSRRHIVHDPVVEAREKRARDLTTQGLERVRQGRYAEGERLFRQSLTVEAKGQSHTYLGLAGIYERQGRYEEAYKAYHILVYGQEGGNNTDWTGPTFGRYILLLLRRHEWQEAVVVYERAMALTDHGHGERMLPMRFDLHQSDEIGMGAIAHYLATGGYSTQDETEIPDKVKHLKAAITLKPRWALPHYIYARLLEESAHKPNEARIEYLKAMELTDDPALKAEVQSYLEDLPVPASAAKEGKTAQ